MTKQELKSYAVERGIDDKIKLGIITDAEEGSIQRVAAEFIVKNYEQMGWKAAIYPVREDEKTPQQAIIRALNHKCTAVYPFALGEKAKDFKPPIDADAGACRLGNNLVKPPWIEVVLAVIKDAGIDLQGRNVLVIDEEYDSVLTAHLFDAGSSVCLCNSRTDSSFVSSMLSLDADIVIANSASVVPARSQCPLAFVVYSPGKFEEQEGGKGFCIEAEHLMLALMNNVVKLTDLYYAPATQSQEGDGDESST